MKNRNFLIYLIFFALTINFFGRDILYYLNSKFYGFGITRLIPENIFYNESIHELILVYLSIVIGYLVVDRFYIARRNYYDIHFESDNHGKYIVLGFILLFSIFYVYDLMHLTDASQRGIGQFHRNLITSLTRIKILIFPSVIFYITTFKMRKRDWFFLISVASIIIFSSVREGARRDAVMILLILVIYLIAYTKISYKKILMISLLFAITIATAMVYRLSNHAEINQISFFVLFGILGGLGTNGILWQVKYYVTHTTGFLYGKTFALYLSSLFIPSSFLYLFGDNEFLQRASYLFNDLYNVNENMGYDFMMIADFYWNFGYIGYLLFILFVLYLLFYIKINIYSKSVVKRSMVFIIIIYFISGLRSDFGFFIKNVFYAYIYLEFLYIIVKVKRKKLKRNYYEKIL